MTKVIFFELNEVPWRVLDWYSGKRPQSNVTTLLKEARGYKAIAPDSGVLSPWITWPTVHRGIDNDKHNILHLGEDLTERNKQYPPIWDILAKSRVKVGMAGSMHCQTVPNDTSNYSFFVPDVFANDSRTLPDSLQPFQQASLNLTRKSARNVSKKIGLENILGLVKTSAAIGLSPKTIGQTISQLLLEVTDRSKLARRRAIQSLLYFDIFKKYVAKLKPDYTCFFTNHVAAAMHRFWAATFKDDYSEFKLTSEWCEQYKDEILWSMDIADYMLGWVMSFCRNNPDYRLLICSSMGQEATTAELRSGLFNLTELGTFFNLFGISPDQWNSRMAMVPDVSVSLAPQAYDKLKSNYRKFRINGEVLDIHFQEGNTIHFTVKLDVVDADSAPHDITFDGKAISMEEAGITFVPDQNLVGLTAYHVPEGILLDWSPQMQAQEAAIHTNCRAEISNVEIAPAILGIFGINRNAYMNNSGFSL